MSMITVFASPPAARPRVRRQYTTVCKKPSLNRVFPGGVFVDKEEDAFGRVNCTLQTWDSDEFLEVRTRMSDLNI